MTKLTHQRPGIRCSLYRPLDDAAVRNIAAAAFRILAEGGVAVYSDTARDAFREAGAEVNDSMRLVRLPKRLVEDAIDSNPSSITLYSRDGECNAALEEDRVHYGTGGTAIYVLDPDTGAHRPSTVGDVILNARLVDVLDHVHVFTINVFPSDVENQDDIDINRFFHSLDHTTKHVMGGIYSLAGCKKVVDMAEIVAGTGEALRREPFVSFITLIISPFSAGPPPRLPWLETCSPTWLKPWRGLPSYSACERARPASAAAWGRSLTFARWTTWAALWSGE
jgi:trimethylamine--corrinoid protein Co-methyltransferase